MARAFVRGCARPADLVILDVMLPDEDGFDEGPGVPEQRLEQVFEPYLRLAGQQQGYGLGLGIARNIAHSHGGELSLRNLREGGLRVTLWLPRNA